MFPDPPQHKGYNDNCTDPKKSSINKPLYNGTTSRTIGPEWVLSMTCSIEWTGREETRSKVY